MSIGSDHITNPTLALFEEGGRHVAYTVPTGTVITLDSKAFECDKPVNVAWDGKTVMMFAEDLRLRAELVQETSK